MACPVAVRDVLAAWSVAGAGGAGRKSKPCPPETVSLAMLSWKTKTTPWGLDVRTGTLQVWHAAAYAHPRQGTYSKSIRQG